MYKGRKEDKGKEVMQGEEGKQTTVWTEKDRMERGRIEKISGEEE